MDNKNNMKIKDKKNLLSRLNSNAYSPDDNNIRIKEIIKKELLGCPELLYALNDRNNEKELFDKKGDINYDGEWDVYFGNKSNIRPYLYIPETQTNIKHYLCYKTDFDEMNRYNDIVKICQITFVILINGKDAMDESTGIPRHDLIASIIREKFNWSNIFGTQCKLISNKESTTDTDYITRTLIFNMEVLNNIVNTRNGESRVINNRLRR